MSDREETERLHRTLSLTGFRAHATATGLLQLIRELRRAGTLDDPAIGRIRDAIVADLSLSRPLHASDEEFRERLSSRLDALMKADG